MEWHVHGVASVFVLDVQPPGHAEHDGTFARRTLVKCLTRYIVTKIKVAITRAVCHMSE